ncbi:MAG TPA: phage holin family protein [Mycobacteriales bacterium]|nr:phage holin family protein [Mycobacteriales bacterium]
MTSTEPSLGQLVASATRDLSSLMRQEVHLAKVEIKQEVSSAAQGAGLFGGAGVAGLMALIFLSISAAYGIEHLGVPLGCSFFLVGIGYLVVAGGLVLSGKRKLARVGPPEQTIQTVKDDIAWAKHPTQKHEAAPDST